MNKQNKKIALLLSGGVDSAVSAHILHNQGYDIDFFYIRIGADDGSDGCTAEEDIDICRLISKKYGHPLHIVSLHEEYWEHVMSYTLDTIRRGLTPHPDIMCNKLIKFGFFEKKWGYEYDYTATGHYASKILGEDGLEYLATAPDKVKDQTDFLAQISYEQLTHALFPIGTLTKNEVRQIAVDNKLPNATRKDSQGICFLGKIDYNDFLARQLGEKPGPIIEIETGKKIGVHKGYWFHTIGQRKGLGLSGGPWYVVRKNIHDNVIFVSRGYNTPKQYSNRIDVQEMNWITKDPFGAEASDIPVMIKNRHTPEFTEARLTALGDRSYSLTTVEPIQGVAPGQYTIIYTPDKRICLGSGIIAAPQKHSK